MTLFPLCMCSSMASVVITDFDVTYVYSGRVRVSSKPVVTRWSLCGAVDDLNNGMHHVASVGSLFHLWKCCDGCCCAALAVHFTCLTSAGPGSNAYLWYSCEEEGGAIVALEVLYDDEPVPQGFVKLPKDLGRGTASQVYLAYRRAAVDEVEPLLPIMDVRIMSADAVGACPPCDSCHCDGSSATRAVVVSCGLDVGYERVGRPICLSASLYLFVKRFNSRGACYLLCGSGRASELHRATGAATDVAPASSGTPWDVSQVQTDDWIDCKDSHGLWQAAQAITVTDTSVTVTYKEFPRFYEETVPKLPSRIAEVRV